MYRCLIRLYYTFLRLFRKLIFNVLIPKRWNIKSIITYFILVFFSTTTFIHIHYNSNSTLDSLLKTISNENEVIQCRFPQLSLHGEGLNFTIPKNIQPSCRSWFHPIQINNYAVRLVDQHINCTAIFYIGEGDKPHQSIPIALVYNTDISLLSDHFTVQCDEPPNQSVALKKTKFFPKVPYTSIHYNPTIRERLAHVKKQDDDFNILVFGLDSVSRLQFQRMLPQTYDYLTKELNAIILKGYNILGDGTPQQLIPMLTGYKELELPSTLYRDRNGSNVDVYPFVWNKYREQGYVTGYGEDRVEYGIWTLRLRGFNKYPTDHYLNPFYRMESTKSMLYRKNVHCIRNQTTLDFFLSYIEQFWSSYSEHKKFFFGFFKQYTHDGYASGSLLDPSILKFLHNFNQIDDYKRTILILMTDHGARFSSARRTPQGKLEERLPFMSFVFPKLFQSKYPHAIETLKKNIHRLTTPFDIHSTLLSLINMNQLHNEENLNRKQRNISLFNLIPAQRTCEDLDLEPHWCSCLQWRDINIRDNQIIQATKQMVNYINKELSLVKNNLCHQLQLHTIRNAQMYQPNQALLKFSESVDRDGRIPKYGDKNTNIIFYQITFETKPNQAIYEATTQFSKKTGGFTTDLNHISRLNAYKSSASCIEKSYSHLRKFCQCIK